MSARNIHFIISNLDFKWNNIQLLIQALKFFLLSTKEFKEYKVNDDKSWELQPNSVL